MKIQIRQEENETNIKVSKKTNKNGRFSTISNQLLI